MADDTDTEKLDKEFAAAVLILAALNWGIPEEKA